MSTVTPTFDQDMYEIDDPLEEVIGIWDDTEVFQKYQVRLKLVDKIMGGVPTKPEAIEGWIRKRIATDDDAEVKALVLDTANDLGIEINDNMSREEVYEAIKKYAAQNHAQTFRRDENGLYISDYQLKASLKESTNILFAGERWGKTKKGPRNFVAERLFVDEHRIYLGRMKPDGTHLQVGHVTGPQGPRSTLQYLDYCFQPEITITVSSLKDEVTEEQFRAIFLSMQRQGIGAARSLGHGQFKVTGFKKL